MCPSLTIYGSGSYGNCSILTMGGMKIMLDAGARCPEKPDIVLITHSHGDHKKHLGYQRKRKKGPNPTIYLTEPVPTGNHTMDELYDWVTPPMEEWFVVSQEGNSPVAVCALPADHDTPNPVNYCITDGTNYFWYGCDTASIDERYDCYLKECDWVMVESNYSELLLDAKTDESEYVYPNDLKERVRRSHCSNEYITRRFAHLPCHVLRSHISQNYNSRCFADDPPGSAIMRDDLPRTITLGHVPDGNIPEGNVPEGDMENKQ